MRENPDVSRPLASSPPPACQQEHRTHQHEDLDCPRDRNGVAARGGPDDQRDEESDEQAEERNCNQDWASCPQGGPLDLRLNPPRRGG